MPKKGAKHPFDKFYEVVWDDAVSNDGWVSIDEDTTPERVISRGWLIRETESYILLASAIYESHGNTIGSTQTIPTGMIVSKREVKITSARSNTRNNLRPEPGTKELHREPSNG